MTGIWGPGLLREAEIRKMGRERQATVREGLQGQLWVLRASSLASVAGFLAVLQQSLMGASSLRPHPWRDQGLQGSVKPVGD